MGMRSRASVTVSAIVLVVGLSSLRAPALSSPATRAGLETPVKERAANAQAAAQGLLARVRLERVRFVGIVDGPSPAESIGAPSMAVLAAFRHPSSLDQLLALGVPFQSAQLQQLEDWGLLEQRGLEFRTTALPVLLGDEVEAFRREIRDVLPVIGADTVPAFHDLRQALEELGAIDAFPAIATWAVRERAWQHLIADRTVDLQGVVDSQRQAYSNRSWWGVLWYVDAPVGTVHELLSARGQGRTVQLCWARGHVPPDLEESGARALLGQLLNNTDSDSRRVRDPERFSNLAATGLIGDDGRLSQPILRWTPESPGTPAAAAEAVARAVAGAFARHMPLQRLAGQLGTESSATAATIGYFEFGPELLRAIDAVGLSALLTSRSAELPPVGDNTGATGRGASSGIARRSTSAAIWEGLPVGETAFRLPW